jgi:hypothetical protein
MSDTGATALLDRPTVARLDDSGGGSGRPPRHEGPKQPGPPPRPDDDWALRCVICNEDWPLVPGLFGIARPERFMALVQETRTDPERAKLQCPVCLGSVHVADNLNPLPVDQAWSKKRHADFDRFYEARGQRDVLTRAELEKYGP